MPEPAGFQEQLAQALPVKASYLETTCLPPLKERFRLFQDVFSKLYDILLRKSLVQEDPYQYDRKISEITVPSRENFPESEKLERLSQRLAEFRFQLEFLNNYCQFSLEFLSLDRLKRIIGLLQFIEWTNLATTSVDSNTASLAEALSRVKMGTDRISSNVITESVKQLAETSRLLLAQMREVLAYQREAYKLELRRAVFPRLGPALAKAAQASPEEAALKIQRVWGQLQGERPFYRELAREALAEDYSQEAAKLQAAALQRLALPEQKPASAAPPVDTRLLLLEAVRALIPLDGLLREALGKLTDNHELLTRRRRGFGARLLALFFPSKRSGGASALLEIKQFDSATGSTRIRRVNLPEFAGQVRRKAAMFAELTSATSATSARLRAASEPELYDFLTTNLGELQTIQRIMEGLDAHFKGAASPQIREQIRGIKIELAALKNCLVRSNKKRYEYASRQEEQKQRQQLGLG
jgi:hypothetical protein